jgi:hypothetical protein
MDRRMGDDQFRCLIACEESGKVRDRFIDRGWEAISCDILPGRGTHREAHYQGHVEDILWSNYWDLVIAFPPCTDLTVACSRLWREKRADGRQQRAEKFFMKFVDSAEHWAIENPVGRMSSAFRKPDQIIQPYEFGHDASKKTCLWLGRLPALRPTEYVEPRMVNGLPRWANQTDSGQNRLPPSEDRAKIRSETYDGIAEAMAVQWGSWIEEEKWMRTHW